LVTGIAWHWVWAVTPIEEWDDWEGREDEDDEAEKTETQNSVMIICHGRQLYQVLPWRTQLKKWKRNSVSDIKNRSWTKLQ
jgi:hypothetical protein